MISCGGSTCEIEDDIKGWCLEVMLHGKSGGQEQPGKTWWFKDELPGSTKKYAEFPVM